MPNENKNNELLFPLGGIPVKASETDPRNIRYSSIYKVNRTARKHILDARVIRDQSSRGTCVSFGVAAGGDSINKFINSPLYNYQNAKSICPFGMEEEGTTTLIGVKAMHQFGTVEESDYPYSQYLKLEKLQFPTIPESVKAKAKLPQNRFEGYVEIKTLEELKDHILHGSFVIGGFTVGLGTFFKPILLPNGDAVIQSPAGPIAGHVMAIIGFDDDMTFTFPNGPDYHQNQGYMDKSPATYKGFVKVVQSYGTEASRREFGGDDVVIWTKSGYGWIPYDYVFGGYSPTGDIKDISRYVNELFVMVKNMPVTYHTFDAKPPYIKNGRTLLPIRFVAETLGFQVDYADEKITITKNGHTVNLTVGDKKMYVNGQLQLMLAAPEIVNGRTYIPIRDVATALGVGIEWLPTEQKVEILSEDKIIELWVGNNTGRILERK